MFAFSKKLLAISVFYDIIKLAVNFNVLYETAQLFSGGIQNEHWLSWRYDPKARFRSHASADDRRRDRYGADVSHGRYFHGKRLYVF